MFTNTLFDPRRTRENMRRLFEDGIGQSDVTDSFGNLRPLALLPRQLFVAHASGPAGCNDPRGFEPREHVSGFLGQGIDCLPYDLGLRAAALFGYPREPFLLARFQVELLADHAHG